MRGIVEALRKHTCLDFLSPGTGAASPWEVRRWLPAIGLLAGLLVAWIHLPIAELLLPADVALVAAMALQAFLLNFGPEQALCRGVSRSPETAGIATAALTLCLLAKFVIYRQFLPPEIGRVLVLGTTAALTGPLLLAARMRPTSQPDHIPPPPGLFSVSVLLLWIAVAALIASAGGDFGHAIRTTVCIVAGTALVQIIGAAWVREQHGGLPAPLLLMFSLPCEIAACAGLLMARSQFL